MTEKKNRALDDSIDVAIDELSNVIITTSNLYQHYKSSMFFFVFFLSANYKSGKNKSHFNLASKCGLHFPHRNWLQNNKNNIWRDY